MTPDPTPVLDEDDERETTPMTDREHARMFGWAWDDPDAE